MADKVKKVYDQPDYAYQKISLKNGDIPGRKAKQYRMALYEFVNKRSRLHRETWDGQTLDVDLSYEGLDLSKLPQSVDVQWAPSAEFVDLYDSAISKVHSKAQQARDDGLNAAVFIAELPSTMRMFVQTARRVTNAWKAVTSGDLTAARRALGVQRGGKPGSTAANNWLELKYGWLPLLSDIDNGARKLANVLNNNTKVFKVVGTATRTVNTCVDLETTVSALFPQKGKRVQQLECTIKAGVTFGIANEMLAHAASLGFTNPMLIAWEAKPLSFVWDWLLPIGQWLSQFSTFHGMQFLDGYVTAFGHNITTCSYPGGDYTSNTRVVHIDNGTPDGAVEMKFEYRETKTPAVVYSRVVGFRRDPMTEFPPPVLPRLDVKLDIAKFVTSMALARQRM